ncbi:hypothetical protein HK105_202496 [Polyrhizophydium stewartii]|uniref:Pentatricopeptide repeat-containing protein n=1 Tax=Polyrhizophydium stewartii TaxID=2732419 RepID=A0ABR4NEX6_9FUNG
MLGRAATTALRFPRTACGRSAHAHALHALAAAAGSRAVERGPRAVGVAAVLARWQPARWAATEARSPAKGDDAAAADSTAAPDVKADKGRKGAAKNYGERKAVFLRNHQVRAFPNMALESRDRAAKNNSGSGTEDLDQYLERIPELQQLIEENSVLSAFDCFKNIHLHSRETLKYLSPYSYTSLARLLTDANIPMKERTPKQRLKAAQLIVKTAKELGVTLPPRVNLLLLNGHAMAGDVAGFEKLLAKMRDAGVKTESPDVLAAKSRVYFVAGNMKKGMQFWAKLTEIDKTKAPYEHLITTHALLNNAKGAVRVLSTLIQQFPGEQPSMPCLDMLSWLLLWNCDNRTATQLVRVPQLRDVMIKSEAFHRLASILARDGDAHDALDLIDMRRNMGVKIEDTQICAEIVARSKIGQHDRLLELFTQFESPAFDDQIAFETGVLLVKMVGPVPDIYKLDALMVPDAVLSELNKHVALVMLLRGYTVLGDFESMNTVFDVLVSKRLAIPSTTLRRVIALVAAQTEPIAKGDDAAAADSTAAPDVQADESSKGPAKSGVKDAAAAVRTRKPKAPPKKARETKGSKVNPEVARLAKGSSDPSLKHIQKLRQFIKLKQPNAAVAKFDMIKLKSPAALKQLSSDEFATLVSIAISAYYFLVETTAKERLEAAQLIAATAKELGVTLPPSVDRSLLDGHALAGDVAGFEKLLGEMRDAGVDTETPDVFAAQSRMHLVAGDADEGMQFWSKLAEIDKTKAPHEHLIQTHAFRRDADRAVHALETLVQQFPDETPGEECLSKLFTILIDKRDLDSLGRVAKMPQLSGAWKTGDLCHRVAGALALGGRFQDALDILEVHRQPSSKMKEPHIVTEIVARDGLGQNDQALALFAQLGNPVCDSKTALAAGAVLVKHVGPVADADQLERVLASHEIVSKLHRRMALVMLLRGYTASGNLDSIRVVFNEMLKRGLAIPKKTLKNTVALVAEQSNPEDAMRMIERTLEAKVPMWHMNFRPVLATEYLWNNFPDLHPRIKRVQNKLDGLSELTRNSRSKELRDE